MTPVDSADRTYESAAPNFVGMTSNQHGETDASLRGCVQVDIRGKRIGCSDEVILLLLSERAESRPADRQD